MEGYSLTIKIKIKIAKSVIWTEAVILQGMLHQGNLKKWSLLDIELELLGYNFIRFTLKLLLQVKMLLSKYGIMKLASASKLLENIQEWWIS